MLYICSGINQATLGNKADKPIAPKKDDLNYSHSSRSSTAPINRGKPQVNAQSTSNKQPNSQSIPAKPIGSSTKPSSNITQSPAPVRICRIISIYSNVHNSTEHNN